MSAKLVKAVDFLAGPAPKAQGLVAITGEEEFFREKAVAHVLKKLSDDVEVTRLDANPKGEGVSLADLLDDLRTQDLFGGKRLIHIYEADAFVKEHEKSLKRFLEEGQAVHPLIIEGKALMGKGRKAFPKTGFMGTVAKLEGLAITCDSLFDAPFQGRGPAWQSALTTWVAQEAKAFGKQLSMQEAYVLHRMVGNRLRELHASLEKLALYVKDRPAITEQDILDCVGKGRLAPVFDLSEAMADGKGSEALSQSAMLFERGVADMSGRHVRDVDSIATMILGAISGRLRKVARARDLMSSGMSFEEAANAVRQPAFFRARLQSQIDAWSEPGRLPMALKLLEELESGLKSGGGGGSVLVDQFIVAALKKRSVAGRAR